MTFGVGILVTVVLKETVVDSRLHLHMNMNTLTVHRDVQEQVDTSLRERNHRGMLERGQYGERG